jgi:hypothetical protein
MVCFLLVHVTSSSIYFSSHSYGATLILNQPDLLSMAGDQWLLKNYILPLFVESSLQFCPKVHPPCGLAFDTRTGFKTYRCKSSPQQSV